VANEKQLAVLRQGVAAWNAWRRDHANVLVDLSDADLSGANLDEAELDRAILAGADLREATLRSARLYQANLTQADLQEADATGATLLGAKLVEAELGWAVLAEANLTEADCTRADLSRAILERTTAIGTNFDQAVLDDCRIYGISAWDLKGVPQSQSGLVVTPIDAQDVTVDDLQIAQFVYLLLNNSAIRNVIDTIGQKAVLILGRFTPERKAVLDAIRGELRRLGFVPMMFDFDRPTSRDFSETIMTLVGLCRFVIADISNPKSSPLELQCSVPNYMVPFVPILAKGEEPFSMFRDLHSKYDWVLTPLEYDTADHLAAKLGKAVVDRAQQKHDQLLLRKMQDMRRVRLDDF
jgi:uncharacterized protein YjbI with pentapeptide repeats